MPSNLSQVDVAGSQFRKLSRSKILQANHGHVADKIAVQRHKYA